MPIRRSTIALTAFTAIAMVTSARGDATFEVSLFAVGIDGHGFVGDEATEKGSEWSFNPSGSGSVFHFDVDDAPIDLEDWTNGSLGGASHGRGIFEHQITDTVLRFSANASALAAGVEPGEYAQSYAQVHGEYHLSIDEASTIEYDLCIDNEGDITLGQLHIRKLVNNQFQALVSHTTLPNQGLECTSDVIEVEAGYYQVYFSAYVNIDNDLQGGDLWVFGQSNAAARLEIDPLPNPADITGDGIVDGADLARVLGAWGTDASGGDVNGDGIVDGADLALVLANWG